ncbi:hypothetical protein BGX28_008581 [Mortierella sp. GBA30]|nr:hypothetical protein BGX28_008581 [Mortierella sp. GBA30]
MCSFIVLYIYRFYTHQYQRKRNQQHVRYNQQGVSIATLPRFVKIQSLGNPVPGSEGPRPQKYTIFPPCLISTAKSTTETPSDRQLEQPQQPPSALSEAPLMSTSHQQLRHEARDNTELVESMHETQAPKRVTQKHPAFLEVISKEKMEALKTYTDHRIWDQIVVGDGREALESASRIAQQYPCRLVLVLVEENILLSGRQKVVQQAEEKLSEWAQYLWIKETVGKLPLPLQDVKPLQKEHGIPTRVDLGSTYSKFDPLSLPNNVFIGSSIRAAKILIDKSTANQSSTESSPRPVKRFNSVGGGQRNNLTINTTPLSPARTVGLEIHHAKDPGSAHYQVLSSSVVFATKKHPIADALSSGITPALSREGPSARITTSDMSADPSRLQRMVLSIKMQHVRHTDRSTLKERLLCQGRGIYRQFLTSASFVVDHIAGRGPSQSSTEQGGSVNFQPILLHRSDRVLEGGRVKARDTDDENEGSFRLEILASTASLDPSSPIQIQVKVTTQPMLQDTFGNTDAIREGEAVLMEGLVTARRLAQTAGWTCLEEDDSQMVEWVRDQMDIQWLAGSATGPSILLPVCPTVEGVHTIVRSRTSSNGSLRVRTPNLSPYASRTPSYAGKARQGPVGLGIMDKRDSTLGRLQEVSKNLQQHEITLREFEDQELGKDQKVRFDVGRLSPSKEGYLPKVTIAAAEEALSPRPGLKTSFGGFSSLNESRTQTLALAGETEDHLGMALTLYPDISSTSPKARTPTPEQTSTFGAGIASSDLLGNMNSAPSPPEPRKLNRFSIKTYQLERSNHGLSDEWALGSVDLKLGETAPPSTTGRLDPLPSTTTLGIGLLGNRTSFGPKSNDSPPATGCLQDLDPFPLEVRRCSTRADGMQCDYDNSRNVSQGSNIVDSGSGKSFIGTSVWIGSISGKGGVDRSSVESPATESVPDFLGDGFALPAVSKSRTNVLAQSLGSLERAQSLGPLERAQSSPSTGLVVGSAKMVHFADNVHGPHDAFRRSESDPCAPLVTSSLELAEGQIVGVIGTQQPVLTYQCSSSSSSSSLTSSLTSDLSAISSSSSSTSKTKAHTRRSWGQGIGGNDILGIQGLSE